WTTPYGVTTNSSSMSPRSQMTRASQIRNLKHMPTLTIISGPDTGRTFQIADSAVIGRLAANEVALADPQASRTHTKIVKESDDYYALDLGSRNGTVVNGIRAAKVQLKNGDKILVGQTLLRFECAADPGLQGQGADKGAGSAGQQAPVAQPPQTEILILPQPIVPTAAPPPAAMPATAKRPSSRAVQTAGKPAAGVATQARTKPGAAGDAQVSDRRKRALISADPDRGGFHALVGWKKWVLIVSCLVLFVGLFILAKWLGEKVFSKLAAPETQEEKL
ncbi:MAG: FHA domain-containing protein, partial [Planctomycetota bacterium]|nr:FHA domain-containing protein [Planctomycetota bacterium]